MQHLLLVTCLLSFSHIKRRVSCSLARSCATFVTCCVHILLRFVNKSRTTTTERSNATPAQQQTAAAMAAASVAVAKFVGTAQRSFIPFQCRFAPARSDKAQSTQTRTHAHIHAESIHGNAVQAGYITDPDLTAMPNSGHHYQKHYI